MKKKIIVLALSGCMVLMGRVYAQTPLFSTAVNESLKSMLDPSGKFTSLKFADGTSQTTAGGGSYGSGSVFSLANGTVTDIYAATITCPDGSGIRGVIADGLAGPDLKGTGSISLETTTPGKNITFKTAPGTGGVYVNNGTTSFKVVPTQYFYYTGGVYATTTVDATIQNFFSIVVSPKLMGANGQMEIYCLFEHGTTSATNPFKIYINDTIGTQTLYSTSDLGSANYSGTWLLENCGSTTLQYSHGSSTFSHGASSSATQVVGTWTVNTNNTTTVTFAGAGTDTVKIYKTIIKTIFLE